MLYRPVHVVRERGYGIPSKIIDGCLVVFPDA